MPGDQGASRWLLPGRQPVLSAAVLARVRDGWVEGCRRLAVATTARVGPAMTGRLEVAPPLGGGWCRDGRVALKWPHPGRLTWEGQGACGPEEAAVVATKVELFELIRRDSWHGGLSVRALAGKYGVHRRLVREALTRADPAPRKTPERRSARLEPFKAVIDGWLRADLDAPRKQRHTATRIHARLLDEHEAGGVSYAAVRDYVARRRPEIRIEEGRAPAKVFIPQHHPPGMEAEVGFGELWVRLAGVLVKCYLFAFRMSYSGKAVHLVSATCGQEAFLEGHVHAFAVLGGVPAGQIRYDNLTPAVTRVLRKGRARIENPRWTAFRSHSLLTELPALSSPFTRQIAGQVTTVSARVRR
jgi:transposase